MEDRLRQPRTCIRWARVRPDLPGGLHAPKLDGDVGFDLEAMEDRTIGPMESCDVPVNARIALPPGWYADIRNRSSMARRGLYVDQNVIDNGYRGPLFVFIRNMQLPAIERYGMPGFGDYDRISNMVTIKAGERIAQLIFHKAQVAWSLEVEEVGTTTDRGEAGFGSTGT